MTTTNSTSEREQRLTKPYKEHLRETLKTVDDYVGYLDACHDEGPETFALAVRDVIEFVATSMRDLCVEKMREVLRPYELEFRRKTNSQTNIVDYAVIALQSLTLEQEQPVKEESCCLSALVHSREKKRKLEQEQKQK